MNDVATEEALISEYVEDYRDLDISFDRLYMKEKVTFEEDSSGVTYGIIHEENIVNKYQSDLQELIEVKEFTREEAYRYKCNPWALSYDLYGTVELWSLLLDLNDLYSASEFTQTKVKVYDRTLLDVIDNILSREEPFIDLNESELDDSPGILDYDEDMDDTIVEE